MVRIKILFTSRYIFFIQLKSIPFRCFTWSLLNHTCGTHKTHNWYISSLVYLFCPQGIQHLPHPNPKFIISRPLLSPDLHISIHLTLTSSQDPLSPSTLRKESPHLKPGNKNGTTEAAKSAENAAQRSGTPSSNDSAASTPNRVGFKSQSRLLFFTFSTYVFVLNLV